MFEWYIVLGLGLLVAAAGSAMYRMRGMDSETVPTIFTWRWTRRLLCGVILGIAALLGGAYINPALIPFISLPAWVGYTLAVVWTTVLTIPGIIIGHGSYFPSSDNSVGGEDNEIFSFITKLIQNPLKNEAKLIGMALTGLLITIPVALLVPGIHWGFAFVGIMKAVGYYIGCVTLMNHNPPAWFPIGTEFGEWWWGFWLTLPIVFM